MSYEVSMPMNMNHDLNPASHYGNQNLFVPNGNGRVKSETGSERGVSPHTSDHSTSRFSSQTPGMYSNMSINGMNGTMRYPSPSQQPQAPNLMPLMQSHYANGSADSYQPQAQLGAVQQAGQQQDQSPMDGSRASTGSTGLPKTFACSSCAKGFARRSDLARHERIHSGVRPHACDHPGCPRSFIQRSALTVHQRVHTGEKPHMCERCGKPFSDSSSLARHRRIHSGKRPYKCPYADCQKTFTRRTTLTRHQNHHTGTIEESEVATAAALASRNANQRSRGSDDEDFSADGKEQQPDRHSSASPAVGINGINTLPRPNNDYYNIGALNGGMAVPPHLRPEMQPSPRAQSPAQYPLPNGTAQRPSLTSNPSSGYNPPQILEPTPNNGQPNGSGGNSPHINGAMGWQSPHSGMNSNQQNEYGYAENSYSNINPNVYYTQQQRPQSTGPLDYNNNTMRGQEIWAHQQ